MTKAYPFNPHIIPGKPLSHHEHVRITVILLLVLILAAIVGGIYAYGSSRNKAAVTRLQAEKRDRISSLIGEGAPKPITLKNAAYITNQISAEPQTPMSESVRSRISQEIQ